jgi:hypothetical protein
VLSHLVLPDTWKSTILASIQQERGEEVKANEIPRIQRALENLRKQHLWGDISDEDYRKERATLERQMKILNTPPQTRQLPNLERAAELLNNLPVLWSHLGVNDEQRESFVREIFKQITMDGKLITAIEPQPTYIPLFATISLDSKCGYREAESPSSPPETRTGLC